MKAPTLRECVRMIAQKQLVLHACMCTQARMRTPIQACAHTACACACTCMCPHRTCRIVKPVGLSRGRGIKMVRSVRQLADGPGGFGSPDDPLVVQRYVTNPMMVQVGKTAGQASEHTWEPCGTAPRWPPPPRCCAALLLGGHTAGHCWLLPLGGHTPGDVRHCPQVATLPRLLRGSAAGWPYPPCALQHCSWVATHSRCTSLLPPGGHTPAFGMGAVRPCPWVG